MSNEETAPLNPATVETTKARNPESNPSNDELHGLLAIAMGKKKRTPLHIRILNGLSFLASVGGLGAALWGYANRMTRSSLACEVLYFLLTVNIFGSAVNFYLACKGWHEYPWLLNLFYSLFMGISLVVFGVINMLRVLLDHIACDGAGDKEMKRKCDAALLKLLIAEMMAISLGFLVATFLHILLVGTCCLYIQRRGGSFTLGDRAVDEEQLLVALMERFRRLEQDTEGLEARRSVDDQPHTLPETADAGIDQHGEETPQFAVDLIDINGDEAREPFPGSVSQGI